jgi:hypothetical protein
MKDGTGPHFCKTNPFQSNPVKPGQSGSNLGRDSVEPKLNKAKLVKPVKLSQTSRQCPWLFVPFVLFCLPVAVSGGGGPLFGGPTTPFSRLFVEKSS